MTNKPKTTEEMLEKGKGISLSTTEHDEMKSTLLSYAQYHGVKEATSKKQVWTSFVWIRTLAASSLALVLFVGTGYASTGSLPGEPLYAMKVNVVEEMVAATKTTERAQLEYSLELAERRLAEVHTLAEARTLTPETVGIVKTELQEIVDNIEEVTDNDIDESLKDTEVLDITINMAAITKATEKVVETELSVEVAETLEDVVDEAVSNHTKEVVEFVSSESAEVVEDYIEDQLDEISDEIAENDTATSTRKRTQEYIEDVNDALEDGDVMDAGELVSEAVLSIEADEYTRDFNDERIERALEVRTRNERNR